VRIRGHPVHPMLVHFPIAFWTTTAGAYVAALAGLGNQALSIAKLANAGGLVMAAAAMAAGFSELLSIGSDTEEMRIATRHMMVMATAWTFFLIALVLPMTATTVIAPRTAEIADMASAWTGFLLMCFGGWLGGRLVYEFRVGTQARTDGA
jgi:uncharacterized membrane protein